MSKIPQGEIIDASEESWATLHFESRQTEEVEPSPFWLMAFLRGARWAERRLGEEYLGKCETCKQGIYKGQIYREDTEGVMWHAKCGDENGD